MKLHFVGIKTYAYLLLLIVIGAFVSCDGDTESQGHDEEKVSDITPTIVGDYCYYTLNYTSKDQKGESIELSELVVLPYDSKKLDLKPQNLIIGCHATITQDNERPSAFKSLLTDVGLYAFHAGYLGDDMVVIPDYQGYGTSKDASHPYCVQELTARQVVDGAFAAIEFAKSIGRGLENDYKTISVGYSQGGGTSLAVQKYLVTNNLDDEIHFAGSICAGGPYSLWATVNNYLQSNKVYMPVACALVIKGMCDAAGPMLDSHYNPKYSMDHFFTDKFLDSGVIEMIDSKQFTTGAIHRTLLDYSMVNDNGFTMKAITKDGQYMDYTAQNALVEWGDIYAWNGAYCEFSQMVKPDLIDALNGTTIEAELEPQYKDLLAALRENELAEGLTIKYPTYFFHSVYDEVVPYDNFELVLNTYKGNEYVKCFTYNPQSAADHSSTGIDFLLWYEHTFVSEILSGEWQKREPLLVLVGRDIGVTLQ